MAASVPPVIGTALLDEAVGLAHAVGACGASRYHGDVGALGVVGDGHVAACDVADHLGDEERRDAAQAVLQLAGVLTLEGGDAADTAADGGAEAGGVDILAHTQTAVLHGLGGCREGIEGERVVVANHGLLDAVVFWFEAFHLGGDLDRQVLAVDLGDVVDATHTVGDAIP